MKKFIDNWEIFLLNKSNIKLLKKDKFKKKKEDLKRIITRFNMDIGFNLFDIPQ
tara:strand:- start:173 stop:334 length:162 start_codon:yes stop_codon:yes gene_type:complete